MAQFCKATIRSEIQMPKVREMSNKGRVTREQPIYSQQGAARVPLMRGSHEASLEAGSIHLLADSIDCRISGIASRSYRIETGIG